MTIFRRNKALQYEEDENGCWNVISHQPDASGYPKIKIDGKQIGVHRYTYELYNDKIPERLIVRHTCDNPKCCNPEHLIVGTPLDNATDRVVRLRGSRGEDRPDAKLTEEQVKTIFLDNVIPLNELAKQYGVSTNRISKIKLGKAWGWLTNPLRTNTEEEKLVRERGAKLNAQQVLEIFNSKETPRRKLAEQYGVSYQSIMEIQRGITWRYVTFPQEK